MADLCYALWIDAPVEKVFSCISSPSGLDHWWTKQCSGTPQVGSGYSLFFGPDHDWRAVVSRCVPSAEFELDITHAEADWLGTRVGFNLKRKGAGTWVEFYHRGWAEPSERFRIASFCWAMYLRILRRYVELQEEVPYEARNAT